METRSPLVELLDSWGYSPAAIAAMSEADIAMHIVEVNDFIAHGEPNHLELRAARLALQRLDLALYDAADDDEDW